MEETLVCAQIARIIAGINKIIVGSHKKNGIVWLDKNTCIGCQACVGFCPINAMRKSKIRIEPFKCISCGACIRACPEKALEFVEKDIDEIKQIVYHKLGV